MTENEISLSLRPPLPLLPGVRFLPGLLLLFLVSVVLLSPARSAPPLFAGRRVLILGDSITQNGAYVTFVEYYLNKNYPTTPFDIVSIGLSSETVSGLSEKTHPFPRPDLHERLWAALDLVKPTLVVACYGMNDGIYHPQSEERMQAFQLGIRKLLAKSKAAGARVVLLTPTPFETLSRTLSPKNASDFSYSAPYEGYDQVLADYAAWEKTLATPEITVGDFHFDLTAFAAEKRKTSSTFRLTGDGVHPGDAGHLLMARTLLKTIGAAPSTGDPDAELAAIQKDPLYALVRNHRETRSNAWLPYIGYTNDKVVKSFSVEEAEKLAQQIQEQIDTLRKAK